MHRISQGSRRVGPSRARVPAGEAAGGWQLRPQLRGWRPSGDDGTLHGHRGREVAVASHRNGPCELPAPRDAREGVGKGVLYPAPTHLRLVTSWLRAQPGASERRGNGQCLSSKASPAGAALLGDPGQVGQSLAVPHGDCGGRHVMPGRTYKGLGSAGRRRRVGAFPPGPS